MDLLRVIRITSIYLTVALTVAQITISYVYYLVTMCYVYTIISHVRYYAASKLVSIQELKLYSIHTIYSLHLDTGHLLQRVTV